MFFKLFGFSLQLAAELDRSSTAQILVEEGAPAGVYDVSLMGAIVLMIQKMPNVVSSTTVYL